MEPIEYVRALRRRWLVVVGAAALAAALGWFTAATAEPSGPVAPVGHTYQATTVILPNAGQSAGQLQGGVNSGNTLAALVELPAVGQRVAKDLGIKGDPAAIPTQVSASADKDTGLLSIIAKSPVANQAKRTADAYAKELIAFVNEGKRTTALAEQNALTKQLSDLQKQLADVDRRLAGASGFQKSLLTLQSQALGQLFTSISAQYQEAIAEGNAASGAIVVQPAYVQEIALPASVFQPPRSRTSRALLAGALGLLAGIALALVLERFDSRIRTKEEAEERFGQPVLSEIPSLARRRRRKVMQGEIRPHSRPAEAFRLLGAGLVRPAADGAAHDGSSGPRTVLVTSPGPGEGKTTVVANLAFAFSELGKKVLVISTDFQRPRVHEYFGVPNQPGLSEVLKRAQPGSEVLNGSARMTKVQGITIVPSGASPDRPGELLTSEAMRRVLTEAKKQVDLVLIDSSPLLTRGEASYLVDEVDSVLVVARAGKTSGEVAERTSELLARLRAPVAGVVLTGAKESPLPRSSYSYARGR